MPQATESKPWVAGNLMTFSRDHIVPSLAGQGVGTKFHRGDDVVYRGFTIKGGKQYRVIEFEGITFHVPENGYARDLFTR